MKQIRDPINIRPSGNPVILAYVDESQRPLIEKGVHLISVSGSKKSNVQVNYNGEMKPFSFRALENPRYRELADCVYNVLGRSDLEVQSLSVGESRGAVLLQEPEGSNYSILFFGRKRKPFSKASLEVSYVGDHLLLPFDEQDKELNRDFLSLQAFLEKRESEKLRAKKRAA